jgi:LysR family glycine cleavage system transcriptional activator
LARKLPPFAALRAFEATARLGTLQAAGDELLVSSSAISHQIKSLEGYFGTKLFLRGPTGLNLTDTGRSYLGEVGGALDRLESCTIGLMQEAESDRLTVHLFHSLSELWLVPRLGEFLDANPDLNIELVTQPDEVDLAGSNIDMAIRYSDAPLAGHRCDRLFDEAMTLVCAPSLLEHHGPIAKPKDVLKHRLICSTFNDDEWQRWFRGHGMEFDESAPYMTIDSRSSILRAAVEGYGVALSPRPYADHLLRSGTLVAPLSLESTSGMTYFLVTPVRTEALSRVKRFRSWLLRTCDEMNRRASE